MLVSGKCCTWEGDGCGYCLRAWSDWCKSTRRIRLPGPRRCRGMDLERSRLHKNRTLKGLLRRPDSAARTGDRKSLVRIVKLRGLEPLTPCMPRQAEPLPAAPGADGSAPRCRSSPGGAEGTRTPDPLHADGQAEPLPAAPGADGAPRVDRRHGGAEGTRTPDPLHAMQVRYQLRHSPRSVAPTVRRATRGILANGLVGCEIASGSALGVRADGRGLVVGHQPQARLGGRPRRARSSRSCPCRAGRARARAASRAAR